LYKNNFYFSFSLIEQNQSVEYLCDEDVNLIKTYYNFSLAEASVIAFTAAFQAE